MMKLSIDKLDEGGFIVTFKTKKGKFELIKTTRDHHPFVIMQFAGIVRCAEDYMADALDEYDFDIELGRYIWNALVECGYKKDYLPVSL